MMNWRRYSTEVICITLIVLSLAACNKPKEELSILVKGAPFHGANGIMFDNSDRLYVASVFSRTIVIVDPDSGRILNTLGANEGVEGPDDLTFGPEGSVYWTSIISPRISAKKT